MHKIANLNLTLGYLYGLFVILLLSGSSIFFTGCLEEDVFSSPTENLLFSVDTLRFDTVFTTLGSATRSVRLINHSDQNISLSNISFESNELTKFRMNVDGLPGEQFKNIEIRANDSLYIFVEVTIDPNDPLSISPFIINDAILIEGGSVSQKIYLEAWGQNANYIPNRFNNGNIVRLTCDNQTVLWNDPKPYVIYGIVLIDSCQLSIAAGTQIYFHGGLANFDGFITDDGALFFQKDGSLLANGTLDNPIVFQGDRLEEGFSEVSGQWRGLTFQGESSGNLITHSIIKNSVSGIVADSSASVKIEKTQIFNASNVAVFGRHANLEIENCLLHSTGSASIGLRYGGTYNVSYTTIANYGNQDPALALDNFICLNSECDLIDVFPLEASFDNCIISGSGDDEILYVDATNGDDLEAFNLSFNNCLVKIDDLEGDAFFEEICSNCVSIAQGDSIFVDRFNNDYHLHSTSPAQNIAMPLQNIDDDIEDNIRDTSSPDLGCYEAI